MFGRWEKPLVMDVQDIDRYQQAEDVKAAAEQVIDETVGEYAQYGIHPWDAPNIVHLQLATAAIAIAQDRSAEIYRGAPDLTVARGQETITQDLGLFAVTLSKLSVENLATVRVIDPYTETAYFDEALLERCAAENNLPYWPVDPRGSRLPDADWQDNEAGQAIGLFVSRTIQAARELQAEAYRRMDAMLSIPNVPPPADYTDIRSTIDDKYILGAGTLLQSVELAIDSQDRMVPGRESQAYRDAHDAFIASLSALIASASPQTLGGSFVRPADTA